VVYAVQSAAPKSTVSREIDFDHSYISPVRLFSPYYRLQSKYARYTEIYQSRVPRGAALWRGFGGVPQLSLLSTSEDGKIIFGKL
jgi:hypothetical protein